LIIQTNREYELGPSEFSSNNRHCTVLHVYYDTIFYNATCYKYVRISWFVSNGRSHISFKPFYIYCIM